MGAILSGGPNRLRRAVAAGTGSVRAANPALRYRPLKRELGRLRGDRVPLGQEGDRQRGHSPDNRHASGGGWAEGWLRAARISGEVAG